MSKTFLFSKEAKVMLVSKVVSNLHAPPKFVKNSIIQV